MPVRIGNTIYCFARGGCKHNRDVIIKSLLEGAEKIRDPHVKEHRPQEYMDLVFESIEAKLPKEDA